MAKPAPGAYGDNRIDWAGLSWRRLRGWFRGSQCLSRCTEGHTYGRRCQLGPASPPGDDEGEKTQGVDEQATELPPPGERWGCWCLLKDACNDCDPYQLSPRT